MKNIADAFENIIIISLNYRQDRTERFLGEIVKQVPEWRIRRFDAIAGDRFNTPRGWTQGAGAWGCYLSHMSILTTAINQGWENYLVFEDDAVFCDDFHEKLQSSLNELPDDWDQFYLGWQSIHEEFGKPEIISEHISRIFNANRTHAFALNGKAFHRFYDWLLPWHAFPKNYHIDHRMGQLHEATDNGKHIINVYGTRPHLVGQGGGISNISGKKNTDLIWPDRREIPAGSVNGFKFDLNESVVGYGNFGF